MRQGHRVSRSHTDPGAVYVYTRTSSSWSFSAKLAVSSALGAQHFGWSVALDATTIVVGANHEASAALGATGGAATQTGTSAASHGAGDA